MIGQVIPEVFSKGKIRKIDSIPGVHQEANTEPLKMLRLMPESKIAANALHIFLGLLGTHDTHASTCFLEQCMWSVTVIAAGSPELHPADRNLSGAM